MDLSQIVRHVLIDYHLPLTGDHGVVHWARVLENGLKLAEHNGASPLVVSLFAVLHDCRRLNENHDPEHGPRAGQLALELQGHFFQLASDELNRLRRACDGHTHERFHPEITIQTCWDADRLDLGRVGILPVAKYLGTPLAKSDEMIKWAHGRATMRYVPGFVRHEWGLLHDFA